MYKLMLINPKIGKQVQFPQFFSTKALLLAGLVAIIISIMSPLFNPSLTAYGAEPVIVQSNYRPPSVGVPNMGAMAGVNNSRVNSIELPTQEQRQALFSKPAVVMVVSGYFSSIYTEVTKKKYQVSYIGQGSGFFINPDGYIVTNAHVVQGAKDDTNTMKQNLFLAFLEQLGQDLKRSSSSFTQKELDTIIQNSSFVEAIQPFNKVILPGGNKAFPFEIKNYGAPAGYGKDVAVIKIELKNTPVLLIGNSDKLQLQNHVTVYGYPGAAQSDLLDTKSNYTPSITDGKVSAKKNMEDGSPVLQISANSSHGNSGGPVLNDQGEVIGILTFRGNLVNGQEVQGFNFVLPSTTIMEFVRQAGGANELGQTDKAYQDGLGLYWNKHYKLAIAKFEEVNRLYPYHSEVGSLLQDSQLHIDEDQTDLNPLPLILMAGAGLILLIGITTILILVRKKRTPALYPQPFPSQPSVWQPEQRVLQHSLSVASKGGQQQVTDNDPSSTMVIQRPKYGAIRFISGQLTGQVFEIGMDGLIIGRNSNSKIVINDSRVSKKHLWVGPRNGHVIIEDTSSTNGTFLNNPSAGRVKEAIISPGDAVIVSEPDVAQFIYQA